MLIGFIFDNMEWCGNSTEPDGIEKYPKSCPGFNLGPECKQSAQSAFWAMASKYVGFTSNCKDEYIYIFPLFCREMEVSFFLSVRPFILRFVTHNAHI